MNVLNVEIKARCDNHEPIRTILKKHHARFRGEDHQVDTYFDVDEGRLKLREGRIENNLIYYQRPNSKNPKTSDIQLVPIDSPAELKKLLAASLGVKTVVDKRREIYFINNVKFHLDTVETMGTFVEIEAIGEHQKQKVQLREQCHHFMKLFHIKEQDLVSHSYSDMALMKR